MRTDSNTLSQEALNAARTQIQDLFGDEYVPAEPRTYKGKVKGAQEAHEAIRPSGAEFKTPDSLKSELDEDAFKLYDLIWRRTVASQMKDAKGQRTQVRMKVEIAAAVSEAAGQDVYLVGETAAATNSTQMQMPCRVEDMRVYLNLVVVATPPCCSWI